MAGFIQSANGTASAALNVPASPFGTQPTAGNLIVVGFFGNTGDSTTLTSVTDNAGNTYQAPTRQTNPPDIRLFYAFNISTTPSFVVTGHSNTNQELEIIAQEFNGTGVTDPGGVSNTNTGSSTSLSSGNTGTLSQTDNIIIGLGAVSLTTTSLSLGSGYSNLDQVSIVQRVAMESKVVSSTAAVSATFTAGTSDTWTALVQTFKLSAATTSSTSSTSTSLSTSTSTSLSTSSTSQSTSTSHSTSTSISSTSSSVSSTSKSTSTSSTSTSTTQSTSTSFSSTSSSTSISTTISTSTSSTSLSTSTSTTIISYDIPVVYINDRVRI